MDIWASLLLIGLTSGSLFALIALLDRLAVPWIGHVTVVEPTSGVGGLTTGGRRRVIQRALLLPLGGAALLIGGLILCWAGAIAYWHLPAYQIPTPRSVGDAMAHHPETY